MTPASSYWNETAMLSKDEANQSILPDVQQPEGLLLQFSLAGSRQDGSNIASASTTT